MRRALPVALLAVLLAAVPAGGASAQSASEPAPAEPVDDADRDADIFGGEDDEEPAPAVPTAPAEREEEPAPRRTPPRGGEAGRDDSIFGTEDGGPTADPILTKEDLLGLERDILQIGGLLYLRFAYAIQEDTAIEDDRFSLPALLDVYLDARPTDRIRGYVRGRMTYDPTYDADDPDALFAVGDNPDVLLDQLWLKFDIARAVYLTIGKQPAKWGTGHIWNPLDFLQDRHRDPLSFFDERTGVTLVKLHVPVESLAWNFYAVAILDRAASLDRIGVAGRAEFVVGPTELALSARWRHEEAPRFGFDFSAGVWDIDFFGEVALSVGTDAPTYEGTFDLATFAFPKEVEHDGEVIPQVVVGFSWGIQVSDDDVLYVGGEYFYNHLGYDDADLYPWLLSGAALRPILSAGEVPQELAGLADALPSANAMEFFYTGRHYGALSLIYPNPGDTQSTNLVLTGIGNFSDRTFVVRFDFSTTVLTRLTLETYVNVHLGESGGELKFGLDTPAVPLPGGTEIPALRYEPVVVDLGLNLRVAI